MFKNELFYEVKMAFKTEKYKYKIVICAESL